jgi:hypothetical protein
MVSLLVKLKLNYHPDKMLPNMLVMLMLISINSMEEKDTALKLMKPLMNGL